MRPFSYLLEPYSFAGATSLHHGPGDAKPGGSGHAEPTPWLGKGFNGVKDLGFKGVKGLGFKVWGVVFRGLGFRV